MIEQLTDGVNFFTAVILSVIIWGLCAAVTWYYHFSDARRYSWNSSDIAGFLDLIPEWLMNTVLAAWAVVGTFPMLNYMADKEQFGSVIGRAREMGLFDERPWYGVGGYQFLAVVLVLVGGFLIHRYREN